MNSNGVALGVRAFVVGSPLAQAALLALLAVLYMLPRALVNVDLYDEGIRLYGGMRVLHGALPYHDFFAYYGPAQFYWPAAWFAVFGEQLLAARVADLVFYAVGAVSVAAFLRRAGGGWASVLWAECALLLATNYVPIYGLDPSLSLVFAAGAILLGGRATSLGGWRLAAAGVSLGVATLFRHDFGLYGCIASAVALAARARALGPLGGGFGALARRIGIVALGALAVAAPVYVRLAVPDPWRLWECLLSEPSRLMEYRRVPYFDALEPMLEALMVGPTPGSDLLRPWIMLAPVWGGIALLGLLHPRVREQVTRDVKLVTALAFLITFCLGSCIYAFGRSGTTHVYPLHCAVALLVTLVAQAALRAAKQPRLGMALRAGVVLLTVSCLIAGVIGSTVAWQNREPSNLERASGIRIQHTHRWLAQLVADIREYADGEPVFVGSTRHDRVHTNLMLAYFLSGKPSATYYHDFLPGLTTLVPVQQRMIVDLDSSEAKVAVLWKSALPDEPNASAAERGSTQLDSYLASHFRVASDRPNYRLLVREAAATPAPTAAAGAPNTPTATTNMAPEL